jgi:hypothetical protein
MAYAGLAQHDTRTESKVINSRLYVFYRSYGGENSKGRPAWYSKRAGLLSLLSAAQRCPIPVELTFINDGPLPEHLTATMREHGTVVQVDAGSNRGSFIKTVGMAAKATKSDDDWIWLAEDDYLYHPDALRTLVELPRQAADYVTLAAMPTNPPESVPAEALHKPSWLPAESTTSTFGMRAGALRSDRRTLQLAPWSGGSWDHTTCLALNGVRPFAFKDVFTDIFGEDDKSARRVVKALGKPVGRLVMNVCSVRSASRRRTLMVPWPNVAVHMETTQLTIGHDWEKLAAQAITWGLRQTGATQALASRPVEQPSAPSFS